MKFNLISTAEAGAIRKTTKASEGKFINSD